MFHKSTWLHLRFPFSFFLLPVYLFALSISKNIHAFETVLIFIVLQIFLYPASNGFNSYFDKDEKSIGALKNPPKVTRELYYVSLFMDFIALILAISVGWFFMLSILLYGLASKAYSHPSVRLKKYPITGWMLTGFFQGFVIFLASIQGINQLSMEDLSQLSYILPAILSTILLWGSYPMTQVYQHEEDEKRGDKTISLLLGIKGTFLFTAIVFGIANAGFIYFYLTYFDWLHAIVFQLLLTPTLIYFLMWFFKILKNPDLANFNKTMELNLISSASLNMIFLIFALLPS